MNNGSLLRISIPEIANSELGKDNNNITGKLKYVCEYKYIIVELQVLT